ncbi:MAG: RmlD substrate binding domain [Acidimicrobiaceae bacterium]|jgi:nucleoside-diphosphate-sugar epimerase|nr:RmlD substrate binding domain [Acidimicrobiaceae bacterium]
MNNARPTVAITGPDSWLRPMLIARLEAADMSVHDLGPGTSLVRAVDTVIHLPLLMPGSASPANDVGASAGRMTFVAAATAKVPRVVVASRLASESPNPYVDALRALEHSAANVCRHVTIVRTAHPVGGPANPGPVVDALRRYRSELAALADPMVHPVHVDDLLDAIEAAADGRIGAGLVELAGPTPWALSEFVQMVSAGISDSSDSFLAQWKLRAGGATGKAITSFLTDTSMPSHRLSSPLGTPQRDVATIWNTVEADRP